MATFREQILKVVSEIPKGKTLTYKEVARKAGKPRAYRAAGNILSKNYNSNIPCHRVIRSDGSLGGYNRGAKKKHALLRAEGARIPILASSCTIDSNNVVRVLYLAKAPSNIMEKTVFPFSHSYEHEF